MGVVLDSFDEAKSEAIAKARRDGKILLVDSNVGADKVVERNVGVGDLISFMRGESFDVRPIPLKKVEMGRDTRQMVDFLTKSDGKETVRFDLT